MNRVSIAVSNLPLCTLLVLLTVSLVTSDAAAQEPASLEPAAKLEFRQSVEELDRLEDELESALTEVREAREGLASADDDFREDNVREDDFRIVNGVLTWYFPTTGALLVGDEPDGAESHCTGTLIGCRTFLTANHCVQQNRDPSHYFVYLQSGGIFAVEAVSAADPEYDFPHADWAVLRLAEPVTGVAPTRLNEQVVVPGTRGQIVGFGRSGGDRGDYGLKRAGRVVTAACDRPEDSLLCWNFSAPVGRPGEDSNTCNADSGGPLFVDRPGGPVVAGITSGGTRSSCLAGDHSYDVDVRQFLGPIRAFGGDDLSAATCGNLPVVGTPRAEISGADGRLAAGETFLYQVDLPAGVSLLRLALNGEDDFTTNFDLRVRRGAPPTDDDADCTEDGPGNYAFCESHAPAAGAWFFEVRQSGSGQGTYQLVATLFAADS